MENTKLDIILKIACKSDNENVIQVLDALITMTMLAHAAEIDAEVIACDNETERKEMIRRWVNGLEKF